MPLPEPPTAESRQLLQTIWDLAFQTGTWPTFVKLDRRWDSEHDSDVVDILRRLPEGFVNGFDHHTQPQDDTRICLTVAGVAACQGTEEILSIFLDFVRVATNIERAWQPPQDTSDTNLVLTDEKFVQQAQDLPAAGRMHLLQLLFQLIHSEASVWSRLGGPDADGHWLMGIDRKIRIFRGTSSLGEYWDRRYKSWEPTPQKSTSMQPSLVLDDETAQDAVLKANPAILDDFLLDQIYSGSDGSLTRIVVCGELRPSIEAWKIEESLVRLQAQGHIKLQWLDRAPALPRAMLSATGAAKVEASRERWVSRVFRDRAARNALLAWLHDQGESPQGSILLANFRLDARSTVEGHFFSAADLDTAAAYLHEKSLIEGVAFADRCRSPLRARMTAEGIDCMEQGGDVARYLSPNEPRGVTYNIHGSMTGVNFSVGDHAKQQATVNGIDAEGLTTLMGAILEALPALGLGPDDQEHVEEETGQVIAGVAQPHPDQSGLRRSLGKLKNVLASASRQALGTVLNAVIDYELKKLGLPPGN